MHAATASSRREQKLQSSHPSAVVRTRLSSIHPAFVVEERDDHATACLLCEDELMEGDIIQAVKDPSAGSIASFIGTTRDNFRGKVVTKLEYECYVPMAMKQLFAICEEARQQWPQLCHIAVAHRYGVVPVEQSSVVIAVSSPHRRDGLEAVSFVIDTLKERVPIWKKEWYEGDESMWKETCEHCVRVMKRVNDS